MSDGAGPSGGAGAAAPMGSTDEPGGEHTVTPLELFFDLAFVFAFTQVTALVTAEPTWAGVGKGLLVVAVVWWAWAGYARLTNRLDPERDLPRLLMLAALAAMLIIALAIPKVFTTAGVVFAVAYLVLRCLHLALTRVTARRGPPEQGGTLWTAANLLVTTAALLAAAAADGSARVAWWAVAAAFTFVWPLLGAPDAWAVRAPSHFVERFGLIIIIALGESVVALGVGLGDQELGAATITAALLGTVVVASLWWTYFDWVVYVAGRRLQDATGPEQARLARDVYAYLHAAMVAAIVMFAFGVEQVMGETSKPLEAPAAAALGGGVSVYFAAHVLLRLRIGGGLGRGRPVAAIATAGLVPLAAVLPAISTLAALVVVCVGLVAYEVLRHQEDRVAIRANR